MIRPERRAEKFEFPDTLAEGWFCREKVDLGVLKEETDVILDDPGWLNIQPGSSSYPKLLEQWMIDGGSKSLILKEANWKTFSHLMDDQTQTHAGNVVRIADGTEWRKELTECFAREVWIMQVDSTILGENLGKGRAK